MLAGLGSVGRVGRHGISGGTKRPSFSVDFVNGGGSLGSGAVFTRASTGWFTNASGTLVSAAVDAPRFDYDPATSQLKGLLLEDASTNLALQSSVGAVPWQSFAAVVAAPVMTANNTIAPDGTMTGTRLVFPAVANSGEVSDWFQPITVTAAVHTFSVWLRGNVGGEQTYISTNTVSTNFSVSRVTLTTQWQRFTLTTPTLTAASWAFIIGNDLRAASGQTSTPTQTIYAWGAQVEALPYMSSYIPTTTVAVTRAVDSLRYPIASVIGFDTTKGSLAHEYMLEGTKLSFGAMAQLIGSNSGTDYISVDEITTSGGSTGTIPMMSGASINVGGTIQSFTQYPPGTMPTPAGPVHRGATSWQIGAGVITAHNATGGSGVSTPAAAIPVIANLTIAGPMHFQSPISQWARRTRYWPRQLSQAELIRATVLDGPTLSLDFMSAGTLDPRITFARASSATYTDANGVVRTAATNAPRWDYANGVLRGLLIEEARTNIALQSSTGVAPWALFGVGAPTVTPNNLIAPDGTTTATRLVYPAVSGAGAVGAWYQAIIVAAVVHTFSVWLRGAVGGEQLYLNANAGATFISGSRITLTTQWQRFSWTTPALTAANWAFVIGTDLRDATQISTPAQTIFAWGAQVEQGAFPTSYIPTTSVSVTRAADFASLPTGAWFDQNFGTMLVEAMTGALPASGGPNAGYAGLDNGSGNENLEIRFQGGTPSNNPAIVMFAAGGVNRGAVQSSLAISQYSTFKVAGSYSVTLPSVRLAANGVYAYATTLGAFFTGINRMTLGVGRNAPLNGWMRRVNYWNRQLSDTELQQVTT